MSKLHELEEVWEADRDSFNKIGLDISGDLYFWGPEGHVIQLLTKDELRDKVINGIRK